MTVKRISAIALGLYFVFSCIPSHADSKGRFPEKGSVEAYNRTVPIYDRAQAAEKRGDYQSAVKAVNECISIYPYDSANFHALANYLRKQSKYEDGCKAAQKAIDLEPNYLGAWISKGICLESMGKLIDAEKCYRKAVEIKPTSYGATINLGDILIQQGRYSEARPWVIKAKTLPDPSKVPADADELLTTIMQATKAKEAAH